MKPRRIILIRHGKSEGNASRKVYLTTPDYAIKLTDEGKQQAIDAGKQIASIIGEPG
jgi:broad specificity phosphatase PhoE